MNSPLSDPDRREFIKAVGSTLSLGLLPASLVNALGMDLGVGPVGAVARGTVFHDTDGTGRRTPGKPGVPGVLVSNGRDLVRTAPDGTYELPIGETGEIFVIKPSGWMVPLNALMLPQHYYLHRPHGTPVSGGAADAAYAHPGISPTGPLPGSIDFALRPQAEPDRFRVLLFGDTQPANEVQIDWMARDTICELTGVKDVAFGICVGDIVDYGRLQFMPRVSELQAMVGVPWLNIPGNHDLNHLAPNRELSTETFRSHYGPDTYAWEYGPVHFVLLNNVFWKGFDGYKELPDFEAGGAKVIDRLNYDMAMTEDSWGFFESYLATVPRDRLIVVIMHMNLVRGGKPTAPDRAWSTKLERPASPFTKRFLAALDGRPHTLSISGHTHRQAHYFLGREFGWTGDAPHHHFNTVCVRGVGYRGGLDEDGIPFCVSTCGAPNGYSFLTFEGNRYAIEYRASRKPADYQMNVYAPMRVAAKATGRPEVLVNVFAGSERSRVEVRVAGGAWQPMQLTYRPDPAIETMFREQDGPTPWFGLRYHHGTDRPSEHLWVARLPERIPLGMQLIEARTTDMFGQSYLARRTVMAVEKMSPLPDYPELRLAYSPPNESLKGEG